VTMQDSRGRVNQRRRTYNAILEAAAELMRAGRAVTMPEVARLTPVSEATAYRHFPDLATLLQEAMARQQPAPIEALAHVSGSTDVVERVTAACEYLLRHVLTFQKAVRATIAATIVDPDEAATARPGMRFDLIDFALAPAEESAGVSITELAQLKRDLAVVMGAEALFCLLDQCGVPPEEAIASIVHTTTMLTRATLEKLER